jgi:hypothetical protein
MSKMLHDYTLIVADMPVGPAINVGDVNFKLRTGLVTTPKVGPVGQIRGMGRCTVARAVGRVLYTG